MTGPGRADDRPLRRDRAGPPEGRPGRREYAPGSQQPRHGPRQGGPEPGQGGRGSWEDVPAHPGYQYSREGQGGPPPAGDSAYEYLYAPQRQESPGPADDEMSGRLVRPYTVTRGRTQPRYHLQVESLVTATVYEPRDLSALTPECQAILQFCRDWRSVAEVSAVLRLPLGVARILIADMGADGLVRIHQRDDAEGRPDLHLLERVLSGLRKI